MQITIDTNSPIALTAQSSDADYVRHIVYAAVTSWQAQHGGTGLDICEHITAFHGSPPF